MHQDEALNQFWTAQPHTIRAFLESRPLFEKLAEEVAYTLKRHVSSAGVEYSGVSHRAKSLDSFCGKAIRKKYDSPLADITDLAGVRIVYLYERDRKAIEEIIRKHFTVIEHVDKVAESEPHEFGYGAVHFLVKLGKNLKGARYDDLRDLICEIQVRTILQDAWAIVAHHLSYKRESDIPKELRRKLNALSGLFETADDQFNQLNIERETYRGELTASIETDTQAILKQKINLDNLIAYANWKLPDRSSITPEIAAELLDELSSTGYDRIRAVDDAIDRSMTAVKAYEKAEPPFDMRTGKKVVYAQAGVIRVALSLVDEAYLASRPTSEERKDGIRKYRDRLEGK